EQIGDAVRRMETLQRTPEVGRTAQIPEPDARLFRKLLDIGAAIAGERQRHMEAAAFAVRPWTGEAGLPPSGLQLPGRDEIACVALRLRDPVGDVDALALGFDDGDRYQAPEKYVVGICPGHPGWPFRNGPVDAFLRPRATGVGQFKRVRLPARVTQ